jgi:DnaJ-class molecular chaperone
LKLCSVCNGYGFVDDDICEVCGGDGLETSQTYKKKEVRKMKLDYDERLESKKYKFDKKNASRGGY